MPPPPSSGPTSPQQQRKAGVAQLNPVSWAAVAGGARRGSGGAPSSSPPPQGQPAAASSSTPTPVDVAPVVASPPPPALSASGSRLPPNPAGPFQAPPGHVSPDSLPPTVSFEEYLHTHAMIQFVAQPALVSVVRTLLDEHPWLTTQVRLLCDGAMQQLITMANSQPATPHALASPAGHQHHSGLTPLGHHGGGGGMPHHHHGGGGSGYGSTHPTPPHGGGHRSHNHHSQPHAQPSARGRGAHGPGRDDEIGYCAVHGNMRNVKHLQFNAASQQMECVPGFHCLDNGSNVPTPTKRGASAAAAGPTATSGYGPHGGAGPALDGTVARGSYPPSPAAANHRTGGTPQPPQPAPVASGSRSSRGPTPPVFLPPHTPPPEGATTAEQPSHVVASPTDPDETRRLEALLHELHQTTES